MHFICARHRREFKERYKIDVKTQPRACHRLRMGCEKVRWVLVGPGCGRSRHTVGATAHRVHACQRFTGPACTPSSCLRPPYRHAFHSLPTPQVKKILTTNSEAPLNVECLMNDIDAHGMITREVRPPPLPDAPLPLCRWSSGEPVLLATS